MKTTILMITHDVEEAIYLSDRIYILSKLPGKVLAELTVSLPKPRTTAIMNLSTANQLREKILSLL